MLGKSIFSWNIPSFLKGNPSDFSSALKDGGFDGVCLKGGEGKSIFTPNKNAFPNWGENIKESMVFSLRSYSIKVYIWHFLYGKDPNGELEIAKKLCNMFEPDCYIWDAETDFDSKPNSDKNAEFISKGLKDACPHIPQALCWWALPLNPSNLKREWHPIEVAKSFGKSIDYYMPMMYWSGYSSNDALSYLEKSLTVWNSFNKEIPLIPVGRAYIGDGGFPNEFAITMFNNRVKELSSSNNFKGISWWVLDSIYTNHNCWKALKSTTFPILGTKNIFEVLDRDEILRRLVNKNLKLFPELNN